MKRSHSSLSMELAVQHAEKKWLNHYLPVDLFSGGGRTGKYCAIVLLPVAIAILGQFKMGFHVERQSIFVLQWITGWYKSSVTEGIRQGDFLFQFYFWEDTCRNQRKATCIQVIINKSRVENPELNSRAKLCSQAVNLPGAWPLMNPLKSSASHFSPVRIRIPLAVGSRDMLSLQSRPPPYATALLITPPSLPLPFCTSNSLQRGRISPSLFSERETKEFYMYFIKNTPIGMCRAQRNKLFTKWLLTEIKFLLLIKSQLKLYVVKI